MVSFFGQSFATPVETETVVRSLLQRLLQQPYLSATSAPSDPELFVRQLPSNWLPEIPLPQSSQIFGSLISYETSVLLETDQPIAAVSQFYRRTLLERDWTILDFDCTRGFIEAELANQLTFCRSAQGPAFTIFLRSGVDQATEVRLQLSHASRHSLCAAAARTWDDEQQILPLLVHPVGVETLDAGSGGSWHRSVSAHASVKAEQPIAVLAEHYRVQIEQAGWQSVHHGQEQLAAWSTWETVDAQRQMWGSAFFIFQLLHRPGHYVMHFQATCLS